MNDLINKNVKKRYEWLDIIKAICIIAVVIFHIDYKSNISILNIFWEYLSKVSGLYKVTIFYCIAGITLNNEKMKKTFSFLFHKFKKLYLKVLIIGLCSVLLHNVFINIGFYKLGFSYPGRIMSVYGIKDFIVNTIYTVFLGNREIILGAFWFVYSLIICFIMLALIEYLINKLKFIKYRREFRIIVTFFLMVTSICVSNCFNITIPRFSNSLVGLFLLDFTNYLFANKFLANNNLYLLLCCIINLLIAPFFGRISMNTNEITSPFFLLVIVGSALYLLIYISKKMENKKYFNFMKYIGKNSFSIMAFHFIGFKIGGYILNLLGFNEDIGLLLPIADNILIIVYYLIFGILVSLNISYVLKKIFKFEL